MIRLGWLGLALWAGWGLWPSWAPVEAWLAARAYRQGDYPAAIARYERALARAPEAAGIRMNLGLAQLGQGQLEEAAGQFEALLEAPTPALRARAAYHLGNARFLAEDWAGAVEAYGAALRWDEEDEDARHNLLLALQRLAQAPPPPGGQGASPPQEPTDGSASSPEPSPEGSASPPPQEEGASQGSPGGGRGPSGEAQGRPTEPAGQGDPPAPDGLEKEDAERVLRYFEERERQDRPRVKARSRFRPPRGSETW